MGRTILVVLVGTKEQADAYQLLQEGTARAEAEKANFAAEIVLAPGFDHLRIIRRRLADTATPRLDAVIVEPASVTSLGLILRDLRGKTGLVVVNAWSPEVEDHARGWGDRLPFGTVSIDHVKIGEIQAQQVKALLPQGGQVLCVEGPQRSTAASGRLAGMKAALPPDIGIYETEAGEWMESDGILAFDSWYALYKSRSFALDVIVAHADELAMGVRSACQAVVNAAHREMLMRVRLLGVDACPAYGRRLVDSGQLTASVITPATTGEAIRSLRRFWDSDQPLPLKVLSEPKPYPATSVV